MFFNSIDFAVFLPLVFVLYWFVTAKNINIQNLLIVIASYVFYGWWDWRFLFLIVFSTITDYLVGIILSKLEIDKLQTDIDSVVLFNAPTYNPARYGSLSLLANCYAAYFSGIKYLDYSDFVLPDYGYGDINHLNFKGASIFSQWLEDNYQMLNRFYNYPEQP